MIIKDKAWNRYISVLRQLNTKAADEMIRYMGQSGTMYFDGNYVLTAQDRKRLIDHAYAVATKYGEGAAAAACEMYDAIAFLQNAPVPAAVPAETAAYGEVAKTVNGTLKENPQIVPSAVGRLVKRTGADTTLQNALRDGAEFAWVPHGDTCAFCITLASRGWQKMSKNALKNGHAEHIHSNCDCTYAIRFNDSLNVEGYDPQVYKDMYYGAEGNTPTERINAMRRKFYAENKATAGTGSVAEEFIPKSVINNFEKEHFNDNVESGLLITNTGEEIALNGVEHHVVGDKSIIEKMDGGTFTHNHPLEVTFSDNDVLNGIVNGNLKELRAITSKGNIYILLNENVTIENRRKFLTFYSQARRKANNLANEKIRRGELKQENKEQFINERLEKWLAENADNYGLIYKKEKL